MAEILDRLGKIYLAGTTALVLLMQPLAPGDPEQQLARHMEAVERLLAGVPSGDKEAAVQAVTRYMDAHGPAVARAKEQLLHYDPARSLAAYRKMERHLEPLMERARPLISRDLYRLLLDLIP